MALLVLKTLGTGDASLAIPTTGTSVSFTGSGNGVFYASSYNTTFQEIDVSNTSVNFTVSATVDFTTQNVSLTSDHNGTDKDYLNITAPNLSYTAGTNNITGTITSAGDMDNAVMTGTANARFYGPAAAELGGTFTMQNDDTVYIGWFGVDKD